MMTSEKALVSVIMNCFNGEQYLSQAVKSVLDQDYDNFEVIFWDNQSTDNSASIFKSFNDKRLKYFSLRILKKSLVNIDLSDFEKL